MTAALRPSRVILIVIDSVGIGQLPDAAAYGDEGSNTLGNIAKQVPLRVPAMRSLGLSRLVEIGADAIPLAGAYGRMAERSAGKDSVTGHWEIAGIVLDRPFPTFPRGFSRDVIAEFERRIGRTTLGNTVASGTVIIETLGPEHMRTGRPIVYTSADSVFQIAAHESIIPIDEQYRICDIAFDLVGRGLGVGRIIARPFTGQPGGFRRTANRRDYALDPFGPTLLDHLTEGAIPVVGIGKIEDLFAGRGIGTAIHTTSDEHGMNVIEQQLIDTRAGLLFANLVDFDAVYGHRNNVPGYAANLERFDTWLAQVLTQLRPEDLLIVTADHGNDPTTVSTDHSREYVPLLMAGPGVRAGAHVGTRSTFADLGQTLADIFEVAELDHGTSFRREILE